MNKPIQTELDFIIDRLANSIINLISGDSFQTEVARLSKSDLKNITKKTVGISIGNPSFRIFQKKFIN